MSERGWPPYEHITVSGRKVNVYRRGRGSPAVVVEAGHLNVAFDWTDIVDRLGQSTLTIAYDRPGIGWSSPLRGTPTPTAIARELQHLLQVLRVSPPVVLVGHSLGGMYVRRFAELFPSDVAGLVLVDPAHPFQRSRRAPTAEALFRSLRRRKAMPLPHDRNRWIEVFRSHRPDLHGHEIERRVDSVLRPQAVASARQQLASAWGRRGRIGSRRLPNVPLVVISAGKPDLGGEIPESVARESLKQKQRLHAEIARLVPRGRLIIATRSDHQIMWQEPKLVTKSVEQILQLVRREARVVTKR